MDIQRGVVVKSINGTDPIEYFLDFAKEYGSFITEHSQLAWALSKFHKIKLNTIPLKEKKNRILILKKSLIKLMIM